MKSIFYLVIAAIILSNCKKDNDNIIINKNKGIVITGKISQLKNGGNSLANAKKILVFNGVRQGTNMDISFADIVEGSFMADCKIGTATALVFLDENNKYIGTLSTQGLNLLPLCSMPAGDSSIIDLSTLTLAGTAVIPSHDPFGKEIIISEDDINSLKEVDGFFESLAKNIDTDNDGALDILSDKQIYVKSSFAIRAGIYGINDTPAVISDTALNTISYNTYISGGLGFTSLAAAEFSGPEGNPYDSIYIGHLQDMDNNGHGFTLGICIPADLPFRKGTYTAMLDDKQYTLNFANVDASYNLVFAAPTLKTNSEGKLVSISMTYQHPDYTIVNPENIITDAMIQLNDSMYNRLYDCPRMISSNTSQAGNHVVGLDSYTLETPIDISAVRRIDVIYNDLLGNMYFIQWIKY